MDNIDYGIECFYEGKYAKALECFLNSLSRNLENPTCYYNVGLAYDALRESDLAISFYKKAIALNPKYVRAINNLAILHYQNNDEEIFLKLTDDAINIDPDDAEAYFLLGNYHKDKNNLKMAKMYYQKTAKLDPAFAPAKKALDNLG